MRLYVAKLCWRCQRRFISDFRKIAEGDRVLLQTKGESTTPLLTKPLRGGKTLDSRWGNISHQAIIGKEARDIVETSTGRELRILIPSLEDYVLLTPRLVTPIYPSDANLIVSLLDIHVSPSENSATERTFEILEAGTGHGALTLYLARAIHAANPSLPKEILPQLKSHVTEPQFQDERISAPTNVIREGIEFQNSLSASEQEAADSALEKWKSQRRAVIHTLDISSTHSEHAKKIVNGFRHGMYAGNVEFNVGDVSDWIDQQLDDRREHRPDPADQTFLSHIILDLPGSHLFVAKASSALHVNGSLLVFNPSITQLLACVNLIRDLRLPLVLDRVLETGSTLTGGKEWDIRAVKPRALLRKEAEKKQSALVGNAALGTEPSETDIATSECILGQETERPERREEPEKGGWEMVCRPKNGNKWVNGGGFLGVWKKMRHRDI